MVTRHLLIFLIVLLLPDQSLTIVNNCIRLFQVVDAFVEGFSEATFGHVVFKGSSGALIGHDDQCFLLCLKILQKGRAQRKNPTAIVFDQGDINEDWSFFNLRDNDADELMDLVIFPGGDFSSLVSLNTTKQVSLLILDEDEGAWISALTSVSKFLRLDSHLYVYKKGRIYEWYKIRLDNDTVISSVLGVIVPVKDGLLFRYEAPKQMWSRRDNLQGMELTATYVLTSPFVFKDEDGRYKGITYDAAVIIGADINATYKLVEETIYGELVGDSWKGVMGLLQRKTVDLTISDLSITHLRSQTVDFALGIFQQYSKLFMQTPKQSLSWTTFIDVFNEVFWVILSLTVVASTTLLHIINRLNGEYARAKDDHRGPLKSLASVLLSFGALSISEKPRKMSSRTIFFTICLFGATMYWSYNAILVSLLAVEFYTLPINSLTELAENPGYRVLLRKGTSSVQYLEEATELTNAPAKKIYDNSVAGNPDALISAVEKVDSMLEEDKYKVFLAESISAKNILHGYPCRIVAAGTKYFKNYVTFAFQKDSHYVKLFSHKILELKQNGQIDKLLIDYLQEKESVSCDTSPFKHIKYENIFTAFLVLAFGIASAFGVVIYERLSRREKAPMYPLG